MDFSIKKRWHRYISRKSKWGITLDFILMLCILLMIIPQSRHAISGRLIRYLLFQPRESKELVYLTETELQWQLQTDSGDTITLKDLQGKVLFINFWATWCPPCVAEMPSINALYNKWKDNVIFILINEEDSAKIESFQKKQGYSLPTYKPLTATPARLKSESIPATYIITKNSRIAVQKIGAANWDGRRVNKLLNKYITE